MEEASHQLGELLQLPHVRDNHLPELRQRGDDLSPRALRFEIVPYELIWIELWRVRRQKEQCQLAGL